MTPGQRMDFVEAARTFLGVPFRHQGRTRRGMDCIGLVVLSLRAAGVSVADRTDYGRTPTAARKLWDSLVAELGPPALTRATPADLQPGDIVAMSWGVAGEAHVGIVWAHPEGAGLIHTEASIGEVVEQRIDAGMAALITGVWR